MYFIVQGTIGISYNSITKLVYNYNYDIINYLESIIYHINMNVHQLYKKYMIIKLYKFDTYS